MLPAGVGLQGYAAYGFGYSVSQLRKMEMPIFSLSGTGLPLGGISEAEAETAGRLVRRWMPLLVEWLLSGAGDSLERARHVLHST